MWLSQLLDCAIFYLQPNCNTDWNHPLNSFTSLRIKFVLRVSLISFHRLFKSDMLCLNRKLLIKSNCHLLKVCTMDRYHIMCSLLTGSIQSLSLLDFLFKFDLFDNHMTILQDPHLLNIGLSPLQKGLLLVELFFLDLL